MESTPSMVAVIIVVNIEKRKGTEVQCYIRQSHFEKVKNRKYLMNI